MFKKSISVCIILDSEGRFKCVAKDEISAWHRFFDENIYKTPLSEAIKAYKSIGYKAVNFNLIPDNKIAVDKNKYEMLKDMAYIVSGMLHEEHNSNLGEAREWKFKLEQLNDSYIENGFDSSE